jgi:hypothetical protein
MLDREVLVLIAKFFSQGVELTKILYAFVQ